MFKAILHKFLSVTLTVLVLCSTLSLTVEKHFCGSHLVDQAYFSSAKKCGMDSFSNENKIAVTKKKCCKNVVEFISLQNELDINQNDFIQQIDLKFVSAFVLSYSNLFYTYDNNKNTYLNYKVPLLVRDIYLLDQVFLI